MATGKRLWILLVVNIHIVLFASVAHSSPSEVDGLQVGVTSSGHPFKGDPNAPVTLVEYSDYLCPFCARHHKATNPELIEKYVKPGKLKLEFRHFPIAALHPTASRGHEAAACATQQGSASFWKFHDALFTNQSEWNRLSDPSEYLIGLATTLGLNNDQWLECFNNNAQQQTVQQDVAGGKSNEFNGTPTFQIVLKEDQDNPYTLSGARSIEYFSNVIDALLTGERPPAPPERKKPVLPTWAKADALAVDPDRPGFTVSGDPTHGSEDARLTIVEFTDYQCPACARHFNETQPAIEEQLVATGKVRWVSKHLPLPEHQNSMAAAAAVECAARQGSFYAMQKILFEQQKEWAELEKPDSTFVSMAATMNADLTEFASCLDSRQALEGVLSDVYEATSISRSTPSFVVLDGESGRPIRGAHDSAKFIEFVMKHLDAVMAGDIAEEQENS